MKKPTHLFETRQAVAYVRPDGPLAPPAGDPRGVRVELVFRAGGRGHLALGLERQVADDAALEDPDLPFALACWLWARGGGTVRLVDTRGRCVLERPIDPTGLGVAGAGEARRIVSLAPSNADLLAALGHAGRLVAVEDSTDAAGTEGCERLGPDLGPDLDRVAELEPDLVLASLTVPGMERVVTGLAVRGVPFVVLAPRTLADVSADAMRIAAALGDPAAGRALAEQMERERAAIAASVAGRPPARVYLEWWPRPMFSPGRDCISNEVLRLAGARNVFADRPGSSVEVRAEEVRARDPDACIVSWCGVPRHKLDPEHLAGRAGLSGLRAVRAGRVFAVDEALLGRPGPGLLEAARRIATALA